MIFKYMLKGHVVENNRKVESWLVQVFSDQTEAKNVSRKLKEYLRTQNYSPIIKVDPVFPGCIDGDPVNGLRRIFWDVEKIEWSDACEGVMGHGTGERKGMQI